MNPTLATHHSYWMAATGQTAVTASVVMTTMTAWEKLDSAASLRHLRD